MIYWLKNFISISFLIEENRRLLELISHNKLRGKSFEKNKKEESFFYSVINSEILNFDLIKDEVSL